MQRQQAREDRWSSPSAASREARKQAAAADKNVNKRVLGAVLLALGSNWLLAELGLFPGGAKGLLAVALVTLGIAMIATAKAGRTKPLVALGVILTVMLAMSSSLASPAEAPRFGNPTYAPESGDDLRAAYTLTAGQLTLDLSSTDLGQPESVRVRVGMGDLTVIVPDDVGLDIDADVRFAGQVTIFGEQYSGLTPSLDHTRLVDATTLTLDLDVASFGEINVQQAS